MALTDVWKLIGNAITGGNGARVQKESAVVVAGKNAPAVVEKTNAEVVLGHRANSVAEKISLSLILNVGGGYATNVERLMATAVCYSAGQYDGNVGKISAILVLKPQSGVTKSPRRVYCISTD